MRGCRLNVHTLPFSITDSVDYLSEHLDLDMTKKGKQLWILSMIAAYCSGIKLPRFGRQHGLQEL